MIVLAQDAERPEGWSEASHGKVDPNYEMVFSDDEVKTLIISISAENYVAMQENMTELYGVPSGNLGGPSGAAPPGGAGGPRGLGAPSNNTSAGNSSPTGGLRGPPPNGGRVEGGQVAVGGVTENPIWVEATLSFEGQTWTHVGLRYKGNSTLLRSWNSASQKLPFKLDFDEFEDAYPDINNQRFHGFKQLSLGNAMEDDSFMRDAAAYEIMREMGLVAPAVTWYEVILAVEGETAVNLGLYTVIEVIDDTVIETAYGNDDGNIYEAEGSASTFSKSSYEAISDSFQKENNKTSDYSDIEAVFEALHAESRLIDTEAWRAGLESVFDTTTFLTWLATNSAIQNWDTYGAMAHNYYLYSLPETGQLSFIGWDYNEALREGRRSNTSLSHEEVSEEWPLIRYLLDDPVYYAQYLAFLDEVTSTAFAPDNVTINYMKWADVLAPFAIREVSEDRFNSAVNELVSHSYSREIAVAAFLQQSSEVSQ